MHKPIVSEPHSSGDPVSADQALPPEPTYTPHTGGAASISPPFVPLLPEQKPASQGRFTILQPHAQGGLGKVSLAQDEDLRRVVALKEIRSEWANDPQARQRFLTEAEITGQLEHPGVVPIYALGLDPQGRPYYAMRFIEGQTLAEAIRAFHAHGLQPVGVASLPFRELLQRFISVCQTIAYAHSRGVIHRDLKPGNVMLGAYGETLVVDWGLAKRLGQESITSTPPADVSVVALIAQPGQSGSIDTYMAADGSAPRGGVLLTPNGHALTQAGEVLGTPAYMSPEQAGGHRADIGPATDIYAIGVILYELLTGQLPYRGSAIEVLSQVRQESAQQPCEVQQGVPRPLEAICLKAMARNPAQRYAKATDLARDVERWLADEPVSAYREPWPTRLARWRRRHRVIVTGAAVLLLTAVVALSVSTVLISIEKDEKDAALVEKDAALGEKDLALGAKDAALVERGLALGEKESALVKAKNSATKADEEKTRAEDEARKRSRQLHGAHMILTQHAIEAGHMGRALQLLEDQRPRADRPDDFRGFEWYHFWHVCHRGHRHTWRQEAGVWCVAFSPDGKTLAAGAEDNTISMWGVNTPERRTILRGPGWARSVAFSPDGKILAAGFGEGILKLWDVASQKELATLPGHTSLVTSVAFAPDGKKLATASGAWGYAGEVILWDMSSHTELTQWKGTRDAPARTVAFSPDGQTLAWSDGEHYRLWDLAARTERAAVLAHPNSVAICLAFSPDGKTLATGGLDRQVHVFDVASGVPEKASREHAHEVWSVMFAPDGKTVVSASSDKTARLWDRSTEQAQALGHTGVVTAAAFSPDGQTLVTGSKDASVKLWECAAAWPAPLLRVGPQRVTSVALSPDGQTAAAVSNLVVLKSYEVSTGKELRQFQGDSSLAAVFTPDGRSLVGTKSTGEIVLWDPVTGVETRRWKGKDLGYSAMAISLDGATLAVTNTRAQGTLWTLWNLATGQERPLVKSETDTFGLAFSPDGKTLASAHGGGKGVRLWDVATSQPHAPFQKPIPAMFAVAFSPDGRTLASGGEDGAIRLWDPVTGLEKGMLQGQSSRVWSLAFFPDGKTLAAGSEDGAVRLWDVVSMQERSTLRGHTDFVGSLAVSQDGRTLVSGSWDGTVRFWRTATEEQVVAQGLDANVYAKELAATKMKHGEELHKNGRSQEAEAAFRQAIGVLEKLVADGAQPSSAYQLSTTYAQLAQLLAAADRRADKEQVYRRAVDFFGRQARAFPRVPEYRLELGRVHNWLGVLLDDTARPQEAEQAHRQALAAYEQHCREDPSGHWNHRELAYTHRLLGQLSQEQLRWEEAEKSHQQALALLDRLAADFPSHRADYERWMAYSHESLAALYIATNRPQEAAQAYQRLLELQPADPDGYNSLAWFLATFRDPKLRNPKRALELAKKAVELAPQDGSYWNTLGVAQYRASDWNAAIEALNKSIELRKVEDSFDTFFLAMAHWQLGDKDQARGWYDKAVQWMDKNKPTDEELIRFRAEAKALLGSQD